MSRGKLILVTGGIRSGKSDFAGRHAARSGKKVIYLATAGAKDLEMRHQIEERRQRRPHTFRVVEEPLHPEKVLAEGKASAIFIVDCLTLLLSNHLQQNLEGETVISWEKQLAITGTVMDYMGGLAEQMLRCPADVIAVTNEVGWGVTPESVPGRLLLNLAGRANQLFASRADEVWLTICGIARRFK